MFKLKSSHSVFLSTLMRSLFVSVTLTLSLNPVSAQTDKTLIIRPESGVFAGKTFYTNSHALVIGISEYGFLPKSKWLDYAARDASDLRDVLIRSYGFLPANVKVLLNDQATRASIEHSLSSLADDSKVKGDDRVLVFFSGHGQTVKSANGGDMGFLIPYDAKVDLAHPENRGPYLDTCIPMDNVWNYIGASPAKHSLLIADACFGGLLIRGRALTAERPSASVVTSLLLRPAQQAITAGGKGEEVQEDPKLGHGYLSFKLLEELKAQAGTPDTVFLASQLASSLKTSVANLTNARQTPQFGNHNETEGDFVFVTTEPKQVPPLGAPAETNHQVIAGGPRTKTNPKDGAVLIFIPAGPFLMGDDDDAIKDNILKVRNNPRHTVTLSGYWIYKDLVTVAMYKKYCQETGSKMPAEPTFNSGWSKEDHPIVNVSWNDARAYCAWAGVTLPTEAQWEKAARGVDGRKFPWGDEFDTNKVWDSKGRFAENGSTGPVGKLGVSPYGCTDMAGNVDQWCADWYDPGFWGSSLANSVDPVNLGTGNRVQRVLHGGSWWRTDTVDFRSAFRHMSPPDPRYYDIGFRCAAGL